LYEASASPPSTLSPGDGRMPDLRGMPLRSAMRALADCNCEVRVEGHGFVVASEPAAGSELPPATPVSLKLSGTL
ncbi:MAG TPA: PASTA domain-containing protein, partial [Candidatus Binatia bacterium]|nr:PASTA domain-containing protein [Candidatus Binatia bacterium]